MSAFFQLWGREMASYFRTAIAYVVGAFFLAIAGVSFWILATRLEEVSEAGEVAAALLESVAGLAGTAGGAPALKGPGAGGRSA